MEHASIFLEKFKRFGFKDQILKETIIEVIKDEFDSELNRDDITMINGVVRINVTGPLKSEIFIKKEKIQNKVLEKLSDSKNSVQNIL